MSNSEERDPTERETPPLPREARERQRKRPERPERPKSKTPVIIAIIAGSSFFLCLGCCGIMSFLGSQEKKRQVAEQETREKEASEKTQKELTAADGLWTSGKKSEAVEKYRTLLDDKHVSHEDRPRVYGRLIDFEYESGNAKGGRELIENASTKGITLQVSHPDATAAVKVFITAKAEQERIAAAKKAEEERLAKRTPEDKLREAQPNELLDAVQLQNDFVENAVAANENYKGKALMCQGTVFSVETGNVISSHQLYLCDRFGNPVMVCYLSKETAKSAELRALKRGVTVRVMGTCRGREKILMEDGTAITGVDMRDCRFIIVSH